IGRILDKIETSGIKNRTIVLFTSDHGRGGTTGAGGNPLLRAGKFSLYEGGMRTGLLAWGCGIESTADLSHEVGGQVDLFKTIADLAGKPVTGNTISRCSASSDGCPGTCSGTCQPVTIRGQSLRNALSGMGPGPDRVYGKFKS